MKLNRGFAGLRYAISCKEGLADKVLLASYIFVSTALWLSMISVGAFYNRGWTVPILSFVFLIFSFVVAYKLDDRFGLEIFPVSKKGMSFLIIVFMSITHLSFCLFGALIFVLYILPKFLG